MTHACRHQALLAYTAAQNHCGAPCRHAAVSARSESDSPGGLNSLQDSSAPAHQLAPALCEVCIHKKVRPGAVVALHAGDVRHRAE
jgi:hypothetical protein